jgi:phenylalanyl-tRNA synthetase beta chain
MKVSLKWLKKYISFKLNTEELAQKLTMIGLEVENISKQGAGLHGIVVGDILDVKDHPNADKLTICKVNIGTKNLSLVCGAPNVSEGQRVPIAQVGAVLADGNQIKTATIRGIKSEGMICSERELGLSDNHNGIMVLDKDRYKPGDLYLSQNTETGDVLEINVTPNRPDCLSFFGIAREIGVMLKRRIQKPDLNLNEDNLPSDQLISVDILNPEACPRYCARVIRNVKIGKSPEWLKQCLESVGIRSINNVVDITNFVLMETGHPLHAFDYDLIQRKTIIVRKAEKGEQFVTLDESERLLTEDDLLICDGERPVALAGIMGGMNSEVTAKTENILLESAYFDPMSIRRTAKRLGMTTEASIRFEKGADPNMTTYAANRAAQLFYEIAKGKIAKGLVDANPIQQESWNVSLRLSRIKTILGISIPSDEVKSILEYLDLTVEGDDPIQVTVPTFRPDLTREIDLIEEVARHFGYEKIPARMTTQMELNYRQNSQDELSEKMRDVLVGLGFKETISISIVPELYNSIMQDKKSVIVQNPLSPEMSHMRVSLIPSLLDSILWNQNRGNPNLRLFEIGKTYWEQKITLPEENFYLSAALTGLIRSKPFWNAIDENFNIFHMKGVAENLISRFHIKDAKFENVGGHPFLKSDSILTLFLKETPLGVLGEVKKEIRDQWDIQNSIFIFEISLSKMLTIIQEKKITYQSVPKYPSVRRDLAVVVDKDIPVESIRNLILDQGGKNLVSVELFDLFQGKQIQIGKKSTAFSLTFLSPERTLTEHDVDPIIDIIVSALERTFSASLRSI